jgi:hypothetical protein
MEINNEASEDRRTWEELFRLQAEYSARLTEETLKYLRNLQAALSPRPPGTVVQGDGRRLTGRATPGERIDVSVEIENRQRVHTAVSPAISPLVGEDGTTWYPVASFDPAAAMLVPGEIRTLTVSLDVPDELSLSVFRGSLMLHGFLTEGVPIEITVAAAAEVTGP